MELVDVDISLLNQKLHDLEDAMIASGQSADMPTIIRNESRLLAMEISNNLGPRTEAIGAKRIESDVARVFMDGPKDLFPMKQRGSGNWLYAGPNFIIRADESDMKPFMSISTMKSELAKYPLENGRREGRGRRKTKNIGQHNGQHALQYNRILVGIGQTAALVKNIARERVGRLRATFAVAALELGETRIPSWVRNKIERVKADAISIFDDTAIKDQQKPSLKFGSRAPGIEGFEDKINESVSNRVVKIGDKIGRMMSGYASDWNNGRTIQKGRV